MSAISSTFESNEPLLQELLNDIGQGNVQLPDFQRPWVWDDSHIRSLLASVSLAYPIGAVMLLQTGGEEVRFLAHRVHGVTNENPNPDRLILDGQQRLTSLYGALLSDNPVQTRDEKQRTLLQFYYFDMARCLDPYEDRYEAVISVPADRVVTKNFGRDIKLDLHAPQLEYQHGLVPANVLLNSTAFMMWSNEFRAHHQHQSEAIELITGFTNDVWMRFQQFRVPTIMLLQGTPRDAVCQVFEKVNTGGVALTVFELVTATFAADSFFLRQDWDERKNRLHRHSVLKTIEGTDFLQAVTLLARYKEHLATEGKAPVRAKRKDVLRLKLQEYEDHADAVEQGLIRAARLLARQSVFDRRNLPYGTQLIPLGAVCAHLDARFEEENTRTKLARWYWCGVFGEMYGGASESRFGLDMIDLCNWILNQGPEPRTIRDADFAPLRLLSLQTRQSAAYKGAMALMVQRGSLDFMNGDPIAHTTGFSLPVDIHHIFPSAWSHAAKKPRELWNSVVNKAALTARTNRSLRGDAPSKYLTRIQGKGAVSQDRLDEVLQTHFIDPPWLRSDDFAGFLRDRAKRLLDAIEAAMGKPVQGRDAAAVVEKFGGPLTWSTEEQAASKPKVVLYDRYEVLREINTGGMSQVMHARDRQTDREVCVKRVTNGRRDTDALQREMQIYDRLTRQAFPHAVEVLDVVRDEGSLALITAWANGGTLEDFVLAKPTGRLASGEAQEIALALVDAVRGLHALDVVHRDIKPANVLRDMSVWKLADFGIAKNLLHIMPSVTLQQVYSRGFAPPEQMEGAQAHPSADIYALGKVICFMLTGETDPDRLSFPLWRELVWSCTRPNPAERTTLDALADAIGSIPA